MYTVTSQATIAEDNFSNRFWKNEKPNKILKKKARWNKNSDSKGSPFSLYDLTVMG